MISTTGRAGLKAALFAKRKLMGRATRGRHKKPAKWLYPWASERRYAAAVRTWVKPLQNYVHEYLKNNQEAILRSDSASLIRQDNIPGGTFRRMVKSLNGWFTTYLPPITESGTRDAPPVIFMGLGNIADSANDFNGKQWAKSAKSELGVEFPVYESWWPEMKTAWQEENYYLIQKMSGEYIARINTATERAVTSGLSPAQLAQDIQKIDKSISSARVNLIARDQIGKLNGLTTQARMEAVGIDLYEWSTSADERVRASHIELDGKVCKWDDPSVYSDDGGKTWQDRPSAWSQLHPGLDIQCRCTALAYWEDLLDEVDREIGIEEGLVSGADDSSPTGDKAAKQAVQGSGYGLVTPLIEGILNIKQGRPAAISQAKRDANINFLSSSEYDNNCQRSIVAYELQRRGYRVTARPAPSDRTNDAIKIGYECFLTKTGRRLRVERATDGPEDLIKRLRRFKDGARFAIMQYFNDSNSDIGHTYIAENVGGEIKFIDPQRNQSDVSHNLKRIRITDGKYDLYFFRIDDAILNSKIDFTDVVEPYSPKSSFDKADAHDIIQLKGDKKMTKDEAKAILLKSEKVQPWTDEQGVTVSYQVSDYFFEYPDAFCFAVYPYSNKKPVDPKYAFKYLVIKATEKVTPSSAPMCEAEFKQLGVKWEGKWS